MDQDKIQRLQSMRESLDRLASEIEQRAYPVLMLEDFKESVDRARTVIWTMMRLEEEQTAGKGELAFKLEDKLIELRIARALKLLKQIEMNIDAAEVQIQTPGVLKLDHEVKSLSNRLSRLLRAGG